MMTDSSIGDVVNRVNTNAKATNILLAKLEEDVDKVMSSGMNNEPVLEYLEVCIDNLQKQVKKLADGFADKLNERKKLLAQHKENEEKKQQEQQKQAAAAAAAQQQNGMTLNHVRQLSEKLGIPPERVIQLQQMQQQQQQQQQRVAAAAAGFPGLLPQAHLHAAAAAAAQQPFNPALAPFLFSQMPPSGSMAAANFLNAMKAAHMAGNPGAAAAAAAAAQGGLAAMHRGGMVPAQQMSDSDDDDDDDGGKKRTFYRMPKEYSDVIKDVVAENSMKRHGEIRGLVMDRFRMKYGLKLPKDFPTDKQITNKIDNAVRPYRKKIKEGLDMTIANGNDEDGRQPDDDDDKERNQQDDQASTGASSKKEENKSNDGGSKNDNDDDDNKNDDDDDDDSNSNKNNNDDDGNNDEEDDDKSNKNGSDPVVKIENDSNDGDKIKVKSDKAEKRKLESSDGGMENGSLLLAQLGPSKVLPEEFAIIVREAAMELPNGTSEDIRILLNSKLEEKYGKEFPDNIPTRKQFESEIKALLRTIQKRRKLTHLGEESDPGASGDDASRKSYRMPDEYASVIRKIVEDNSTLQISSIRDLVIQKFRTMFPKGAPSDFPSKRQITYKIDNTLRPFRKQEKERSQSTSSAASLQGSLPSSSSS